ncbi:hypothetical protein [Clostridium tetani]|uniref:hypothetical protein n=1 Tax=Clostridium tetani TaxID=1513 RepID=UPI0005144EE3|nr:hypothetical protein [Clostridium tetani]KGI36863.1 hypothetical protein LA33_12090 [Clostridium tetani ATCC 9441]SUY82427.1 Uncharacterised protein [Clostridium tetani]
MNKGYEIVQLNNDRTSEALIIHCPVGNCPNVICNDQLCNVPIGICTCPPPAPDSGCHLAICGLEMNKNPGNR